MHVNSKGGSGIFYRLSKSLNMMDAVVSRFPARDVKPIPRFFLRGSEASLINICPRYPKSTAPILFHLPDRTIERILETIPPHLVGPAFVFNGRVKFGLDSESLSKVSPRWAPISDRSKARKHMTELAELVCRRATHIPEDLLSETICITGSLRDADVIPEQMANEILRTVLPICLDKLTLSRQDVFNIVYGLNRIPITSSNAVLFPLIAQFGHWYLSRRRINDLKRLRAARVKQQIDTFISS